MMAPVWPVIPEQLACEIEADLAGIATRLDAIRGRCAGYPEAPKDELKRAIALLDGAHDWFARQAAPRPTADRIFALLPRSAHEATTVEAVSHALGIAPSTARRHLQQLVHEGRALVFTNTERRASRYYRNPLNGERTTYGDVSRG